MTISTLRVSSPLLGMLLLLSCESLGSKSTVKNQGSETLVTPSRVMLTDETIMALVRKFGAGFENEQLVYNEIARYPRDEIIVRLKKIHDTLADSASDRIAIAFLLCNLDYEVEKNKKSIVEAFTQKPHFRNLNADWEAELITRLITKGHKDLLPILFLATEWADGALSQSLSPFLADQLRTAPQDFVSQLSTQPTNIRRAVCTHLRMSELSERDLDKLKIYMNSTLDSNERSVAHDILRTIRMNER